MCFSLFRFFFFFFFAFATYAASDLCAFELEFCQVPFKIFDITGERVKRGDSWTHAVYCLRRERLTLKNKSRKMPITSPQPSITSIRTTIVLYI